MPNVITFSRRAIYLKLIDEKCIKLRRCDIENCETIGKDLLVITMKNKDKFVTNITTLSSREIVYLTALITESK